MFWTPNHNQATHSLQITGNKGRRWGMMSIVLDTQSQPGYSPPTNERTQGKEIGNDEYCSGHPITTMLLTLYM